MAATGKILGTVTSVVGEAKATAADGTVRILQVGDTVRSDETITTSAAGAVNIALENGKTLDCGANTDLSLHESILGVSTAAVTSKPAAPGSVEALQQAIASGQDPSQIAPATAAGGAPAAGGAGDGGGGSPVIIEQANTAGIVESGFPTAGGSIAFPTPEFELQNPEEEPPAVSVSVQVQVQVQVQVEVDVSIEAQPVVNGPSEGGVFAVSASGDAVSLIEGTAEGTIMIPFVITLDKVFDTDVQVTYQIVPDSASTPSDFFDGELIQTITIPAGETSFIVPIQIVRDHFVEGHESFHIVLLDATNATINPNADSASVTIFNDDAPPIANPDTNWAQEDTLVVASGNVLQDQDHTAGAPSGTFADDGDTDFEPLTVTDPRTEDRATGTLELNSNGSYTFTLNNSSAAVQALDSGETLTESYSYTVTDGFNAPDTATLTVTIFGSNDTPEITVKTSGEIFASGAQGTVDEAALANGSNSSSNAEFVTGNFKVADTDGIEDIQTVTINGQTVAVGNLVGAVFHGSAGDMTVTSYVDGVATFTYELLDAVTHNQANQTPPDVFTLTASDGTSSSAPANITISILDDVPSTQVTASPATSTLTVDETVLATNATANFAGDFAGGSSFGADGPGSVSDAIYTLSINNGPTGLVDTATNQAVTLAMNGSVVEGRVSNGEGGFLVVFTVSVNGSGDVTLDQQRAVVHSPEAGPDQSTTLASANLVVLNRTATITDADGDTANASASINIGQALNFEDDAPSIDVSLKDVAVDSLAVDETALTESDSTSASANFADNFNSSPDFNEDGAGSTSPSFALSLNAGSSGLVDTATDQDVVLSLTLAGVVEGRTATSGDLVFTMSVDGAGTVTLTQLRAVVHADGSDPDDTTGMNSGLVILTRTDTITDKDGDSATDSASIDVGSAVSFDDDGPTLTVTAGAATGLALNVDETDDAVGTDRYNTGEAADDMNPDGNAGTAGLGTVTTAVAGGLTTLFAVGGDAGADGQASQTGTMSFVFTQAGPLATNLSATNGGAISLVLVDSTTIAGRDASGAGDTVFTIQIVDVGGGVLQLQLTQNEAINHGGSENPSVFDEVANLLTTTGGVQLQYSVTRVDGDGDSITDADQINLITTQSSFFSFDDDGPTLTVTAGAGTGLALNVDETDDAAGTDRYNTGEAADDMNPDGNALTASLGAVTTAVAGGLTTLFTVGGNAGSDGQASQTGTTSFVFTQAEPLATNLSATNGGAISLVLVDATTIAGRDASGAGDTVFTIQIVDVGGVLQLRLTQNEAINHGSSSLYDEVANLLTTAGGVQLQYSVTRVDGDGDSITDADQIDLITNESSFFSFDDDGPKATVNNTSVYNDDNSFNTGTQSFNFGSDGMSSLGALVLTSTGGLPATYSLLQTDGDTWKAVKNGVSNSATDLFSIDMDPSAGTYTFTVLNHEPPVPVEVDIDSALTTANWFDENGDPLDEPQDVYTAVIEPSGNNPFRITASGSTGTPAVAAEIAVQNATIGVGGDDDLHSQFDDVFNLSLQNMTGEQTAFTSISLTLQHFNVANENFAITVTGTDALNNPLTVSYLRDSAGVTYLGDDPEFSDSDIVSINVSGFKSITQISTANTDGVFKVVDFDLDFTVLKNVGDKAYSFLATAKDGDADAASDAFTVTVLAGTSDDDNLITGAGNQTVSGGEGNDTINGGAGNDILIGGEGSDTYVFTGSLTAGNSDTVQGFDLGSGGDVLNLHDVLPGAAQGQTTEEALSAYVIVQSGTNTTISVDADGGGAGAAVLVVTLEGVNTTLAQLLNNNQIVT